MTEPPQAPIPQPRSWAAAPEQRGPVLLAQLVQALGAVARPGLSPATSRRPGSAAGSWEASLCQAAISAPNDVPRAGAGSRRLPAGPPPPRPPRPSPLRPLCQPLVWPARPVWCHLAPAAAKPAQREARAVPCPRLSPRGGGDPTGRARWGLRGSRQGSRKGLGSPPGGQHNPQFCLSCFGPSAGTARAGMSPGWCHHAIGDLSARPRGSRGEQKRRSLPRGLAGGCTRPRGSCSGTGRAGRRGDSGGPGVTASFVRPRARPPCGDSGRVPGQQRGPGRGDGHSPAAGRTPGTRAGAVSLSLVTSPGAVVNG